MLARVCDVRRQGEGGVACPGSSWHTAYSRHISRPISRPISRQISAPSLEALVVMPAQMSETWYAVKEKRSAAMTAQKTTDTVDARPRSPVECGSRAPGCGGTRVGRASAEMSTTASERQVDERNMTKGP